MEIWIALFVLCVGSLAHNDLYFRGKSDTSPFVYFKYTVMTLVEAKSKHATYAGLWFILMFVVFPFCGTAFFLYQYLVWNKAESYREYWKTLRHGWQNWGHDRRLRRYRQEQGKRSRARLAEMNARKRRREEEKR